MARKASTPAGHESGGSKGGVSVVKAAVCVALAAVLAGLLLCAAGGAFLASNVQHPPWYKYTTTPGLPGALLPELDGVIHRNWGACSDPGVDFGLMFNEVEINTEELWESPVTKESMPMRLRGWLITPDATSDEGVTNQQLMAERFPDLQFTLEEGAVAEKRGVVAIHGAGVDRREILRHLPLWVSNGFAVLMVDCRDHGISDGYGRGPSYGLREREDAVAAVNYAVEECHWEDVVLFGSSQGGTSVLLAAAQLDASSDHSVACVIAENPFAEKRSLWLAAVTKVLRGERFGARNITEGNFGMWLIQKLGPLIPDWLLHNTVDVALWKLGYGWHPVDDLDSLDHMHDITAGVLLLHGTHDTVVPPSHSQQLFDAAENARVRALEWYEEGRHGLLISKDPVEYHKDINEFVGQCLSSR